jgi:hypothetical protein
VSGAGAWDEVNHAAQSWWSCAKGIRREGRRGAVHPLPRHCGVRGMAL